MFRRRTPRKERRFPYCIDNPEIFDRLTCSFTGPRLSWSSPSPGGTFKNENRPLASVVVLRTWDVYRSFDSVTVARARGSPVPNLATTPSTDAVLLNCASRPRMTAHSIIEPSEILDACRLYPQCYQRPFQGGAPGFSVLTQTASPGERTVKVRS